MQFSFEISCTNIVKIIYIIMKKIVIVFGGASVEHDVSIITGLQAINSLKEEYEVIPVYLSLENTFFLTDKLKPSDYFDKEKVKKSSTLVTFFDGQLMKIKKTKLQKLKDFDCVLNCCHGGVGENGELNAFFKLNNINCSSANTFSSGVCMNKYFTKLFLRDLGVPVVDGVLINKYSFNKNIEVVAKTLKDDLIVKPNSLGSSIGVNKTTQKDVKECVQTVLQLDDEVLVENCVTNMYELNCACYQKDGEIIFSQIEKVGNKKEILSFDDKYISKEDKREIPAKIDKDLEEKIKNYTSLVYRQLRLSGVIRIDYIYDRKNKKLYLNEINTIPGSMAYYLFQGLGINYSMLCEDIINQSKIEKQQIYFKSDILSQTGLKVK